MKKFKIADMWISTALIIASFIWLLFSFDLEHLVTTYVIVGGWQLISMGVHAVNRTFTSWPGIRVIYHWISVIMVVTIPLGSAWILVFVSPFMAIFYTWLCFYETCEKMRRPISYLK